MISSARLPYMARRAPGRSCYRIVWHPIASPGHVLIGTRKQQFAWVERSRLIRLDVHHSQRHAAVGGGGKKVADIES
jgi:hypothetical protein